MLELTTTRSNPLVDPGVHVWGWEIPTYLFLGGLVAGLMILAGRALLTGDVAAERRRATALLPRLGIVLLSLGMLALFLDLSHKPFFWRLYTTFMPRSPMSWGSWILLLVYPAMGAAALLWLPESLRSRAPRLFVWGSWLASSPGRRRTVAWANLLLGAALGIYTGILLSSLGARPLWSSALLGPLFLASGLSSAAALAHLLERDHAASAGLLRLDSLLLVVELAIVALFLIGLLSASKVHAAAAHLLLGGPYAAVFWVLVVGSGIVVPLLLQTLELRRRIASTRVSPLLVLLGGVLLRVLIVYAGQASHYGS